MRHGLLVALILFIEGVAWPSFAQDLGDIGETVEIIERPLDVVIRERISALQEAGEFDRINQRLKRRVKKYVSRPTPVEGLGQARENRSYFFDPSVVLDTDVVDAKGNILHRKGASANPLHYTSLSRAMVFFNADSEKEMSWAKQFYDAQAIKPYMIMVAGHVENTMKKIGGRIYFDQRGTLVKQMHIENVPAIVSQEGEYLRIDEVGVYP